MDVQHFLGLVAVTAVAAGVMVSVRGFWAMCEAHDLSNVRRATSPKALRQRRQAIATLAILVSLAAGCSAFKLVHDWMGYAGN